jgi:hypothetical protein
MEIEVEELDGVYETTIASAFNRRVSKHLVMVVTIRDGVAVIKYKANGKTFDVLSEAVDAYNEV